MIAQSQKVPARSVLDKPAYWVRALKPWQARGLAFFMGAAFAVAHAPFHIWPLALMALTGLVWLLDGAAKRERSSVNGAFLCWFFGVGQFLAGTYWIGSAFIERGAQYVPIMPFAVLFFSMGLALFWLAAGWVAMRFWSRRVGRVLVLAAVLFAFEWLRGHIFTGFPWNHPGLIWPAGGALSQNASWFGAWGLGLVTLVAFTSPAALTWSKAGPLQRALPALGSFLLFALLFASGLARLASTQTDAQNQMVAGVTLRVLQVQIDQSEKWKPENRQAVINKYLDLSSAPGLGKVTHMIWPEGALPLLLLEEPKVLEQMATRFANGPILLTGLTRRETGADNQILYRNSMGALAFRNGIPSLEMIYDKHHLTPFGEYMPFGRLLAKTGISALTRLGDGFTPGAERVTASVPGAPLFSPQICYEAIFSGFTLAGAERPQWIVNVTNDSWFGASSGPYQHALQARYRAIEEGLPLVRSASSGISGVVDPFGRMPARLDRGADRHIDAGLPKALPATFYSRYAAIELVLWILLVISTALVFRRPLQS